MKSREFVLGLLAAVLSPWPGLRAEGEIPELHEMALVRRPVAAALCDDGRLLCVVNQQSGSLSVIDVETRRMALEVPIGEKPSDIAVLPDGKTVLVTDEAAHALLLVRPSAESVDVIDRLPMPRSPVNVTVCDNGRLIAVAGLWSHRVALLSVNAAKGTETSDLRSQISDFRSEISDFRSGISDFGSEISVFKSEISHLESLADSGDVKVVRLPFAPRMQVFVSAAASRANSPGDDSRPAACADAESATRLVVADAFGGNIAVIDPERGEVESMRTLPAHNVRGLALSADGARLLISHQVLSPLARTDFDDVHWGNLMQNVIRELSLASLLEADADLLNGSRLTRLGEVGNGAADPAGLAVVPADRNREGLPANAAWVQALSGVGEVLIDSGTARRRLPVGSRPLDVVLDPKRRVAYVVCTLDDAIAVVDLDAADVAARIALGPRPQPTPRERGERLFFDGRRSHDGWLSCHSCHTDGHTNGGLADTLGDETYGTPKTILSLLGVRDTNPWGWTGRFRELHAQVEASFTSTMHGEAPSASEAADVVAFLQTLRPPPPVDDPTDEGTDSDAQSEQGRRLFVGLGCRECHVPPLTYTIDAAFDVGLADEAGRSEFNPPSLRGVGQRTSFLHDGRAQTLEAVFSDHAHQLPRELAPEELDSLLAFLRSL